LQHRRNAVDQPPARLQDLKMTRTNKAVKAGERHSWRDRAETDVTNDTAVTKHPGGPARARTALATVNARFAARAEKAAPILKNAATPADASTPAAGPDQLSVRAENVLKELSAELTGDNPPKGRWIPTDGALRKLTFNHLSTARNCGPQTIDEIVAWAATRGVIIRKPSYAGKSLATMWRDLFAKFSSGEFSKAEISEALERSMRRKNTKIPVAIQRILLQILTSGS
jgi:hypothetical protein